MDKIYNAFVPLEKLSENVLQSISAMKPRVINQHWDNFKKQLFSMYQSQTLCDVKLTADNVTVFCHRVVLAAGSSYFFTMFNSNMCESDRSQEEVKLSGLEPGCLKVIVDFLYTGKLCVNEENAQGLLEASDMLLLDPVREVVGEFYSGNLTIDNCIKLWNLSDQLNNKVLARASFEYIAEHFINICDSQDFLELDASKVKMLLHYSGLKAASEDAICLAGLKWMNKEPELRAPLMINVLSGINFLELTIDFICFYVMEQTALQREKKLMQRCRDVVDYIQLNIQMPKWLELHPPRTNLKMCMSIVLLCDGLPDFVTIVRQDDGKYTVSDKYLCKKPYNGIIDMDSDISDSSDDNYTGNYTIEACVSDNKMYVFGPHGKRLWCFNGTRRKWSRCADAVEPRVRYGFASGINCKLYLLGGYSEISHSLLTSVEEYDTKANKWGIVGNLQVAVESCGACFYSGSVYVFGGEVENDGGNEEYIKVIQQFNTFTKTTCILKSTLPASKAMCTQFVIRDMLVFFDGEQVVVAEMAALADYDHAVQWAVKPVTEVKSIALMTVYGDKIVLVGNTSLDPVYGVPLNKGEILEASINQLLDTSTGRLDWEVVGHLHKPMLPEVVGVLKL